MKMLILSLLFILALGLEQAIGQETVIHPTIPGTSVRDYSQPSLIQEGNMLHQTIPGTTVRDYSKPSYIIERESPIYQYQDQDYYYQDRRYGR